MPHPGTAAAIAHAYGLGPGAGLSDGPVARGNQGRIWRLDTGSGSWAVKQSFRPLVESEVRDHALFQEAVGSAGVPVPPVVWTTVGTVLADVGGGPVRVFGWVDLRPPDIRADPVLVGSTVARIHRVRRTEGDPFDEWFTAPVGADRWDALVTELRAAGAPFAEALAGIRDELRALEEWMAPPRNLQVCHRDLWADNLRLTADGRMCVIDWEGSGLADPSQELACVLFEFGSTDPGRARTLYRAYLDAGGPGRVDGPACFSMVIAQLGHIAEAACRDWMTPTDRSSRSDSAASIAEFVDRPHHRAVLHRILQAIG